MKTARTTLIEMIIGIWVLAAVVIAAGVFFVSNPLSYVLGEVVGSGTATLLMLHMYHSIDIELDLPKKKSVNHARIMIILRSLIELGVLFGSFYIEQWVLPYTVLAGLFGRKFAPMFVPAMEKFLKKGE